jgi:hypothetical protein
MKTTVTQAALVAGLLLNTSAFAQTQNHPNPFRSSSQSALAEGGVQGGGGDTITEGRIHEIRRDIQKWINAGGAKSLDFSNSRARVTYEHYLNGSASNSVFGMNDVLRDGAVVINAIRESEQNLADEELNTYVSGYPKTCKGLISKRDGRPHILCNIERFWELKAGWEPARLEAEQYRLIHHEFASLAGLEKNVGSDSDMSLSSQLTKFLKPESVLRLAVVQTVQPTPEVGTKTFNNPKYNGLAFMAQKSERKNQKLANEMCLLLTHRKSIKALKFSIEAKSALELATIFPDTYREGFFSLRYDYKFPTINYKIYVDGVMEPRHAKHARTEVLMTQLLDVDNPMVRYFSSVTCELFQ